MRSVKAREARSEKSVASGRRGKILSRAPEPRAQRKYQNDIYGAGARRQRRSCATKSRVNGKLQTNHAASAMNPAMSHHHTNSRPIQIITHNVTARGELAKSGEGRPAAVL